jgi:prepilin-type N-terminal cleavage/methylation domain-containing protein
MLQNVRKLKEGFTIIEVMIVLAIAGLILLIVFLAVPALQRNAHNTANKNDIAGLLGGMNEFVNNNNGNLPANAANLGAGTTATIGTGAGVNPATVKLGYYDAANVSIVSTIPGTVPALGNATIIKGAVCNGNTPVTAGASARNYVAYFQLEGGATQCQAS